MRGADIPSATHGSLNNPVSDERPRCNQHEANYLYYMKTSVLNKATTGLAGALALAGGSQAYGSIVFSSTPPDIVPTSGTFGPYGFSLDVDHNGTRDIGIFFYQASTSGYWLTGANGFGGVGVAAPVGYASSAGYDYASRLSVGYTVSASSTFHQDGNYVNAMVGRYTAGGYFGPFGSTGKPFTGWVGFEFTEPDGLHFGALNVTVAPYSSADDPGGIHWGTLEYESVAGAPLVITNAVPEPGTLAALAFGGAGLAVALRRRRGKEAAPLAA